MSDDENDDVGDLTSLEDLGEFLHQDDPDLDAQLDSSDSSEGEQALAELNDLDDAEESFGLSEEDDTEETEESDPPPFDKTPDLPDEAFEGGEEDSADFGTDATEPDVSFEEAPSDDEEMIEDFPQDDAEENSEEETETEETTDFSSEKDSFAEESGEEEAEFASVDNSEMTDDSFSTDELDNDSEEAAEDFPEEDEGFDSFASEDESEPLTDSEPTESDMEFGSPEEPEEDSFAAEPEPEEIETNQEQNQSFAEELVPQAEEAAAPIAPTTPAPRENFNDIKEFGESISYGSMALGGNPPYSLIIKGIKYLEDAEDIMIVLREHGLVTAENESEMETALANGCVLISQISEYSAIYLAHRIRRFEVEVLLGLSEELHPSKAYESDQKGLINKESLGQNRKESLVIEAGHIEPEAIILTTTPTLEGYIIQRYISLATEHTIVDEDELERMHLSRQMDQEVSDSEYELSTHIDQDTEDEHRLVSNYGMGLIEIYQDLSEELRTQAFKLQGNAVVGITFQLTPLLNHSEGKKLGQYKITCTGNIVWVIGQGEA